ncbi:MAG: endo-1,4-beta-xylanase [Oscillospiraceae bacterium]|nr:endo-1,4-beta-xylanase [Oscillospiraceae bacterium]
MAKRKLANIFVFILAIVMLASIAVPAVVAYEAEAPVPTTGLQPIFTLSEYYQAAYDAIGSRTLNLAAINFVQNAGAGSREVERSPVDNSRLVLAVRGRTADWNAVDIIRGGAGPDNYPILEGDRIVVYGRTTVAGAAAIDGGSDPWPHGAGTAQVTGLAAGAVFRLQLDVTEAILENPGFSQFRIRTRDIADFLLYDIIIYRDPNFVPTPPPPPPQGDLIWSLADYATFQDLPLGMTGVPGVFNAALGGGSGAVAISSGPANPVLTIVEHPTVEDQVSIMLQQRLEDWHAVDFIFDEIGVQRGGAYRFVAYGRLSPGAPPAVPNARNVAFLRPEAPWGEWSPRFNAGSPAAGGASNPYFRLEFELDRYDMNDALLAGQGGIRLAQVGAGGAARPNIDFTIDDMFVYQLGYLDLDGLPAPPEWDLTLPSLAELFAPFFPMGNIYSTHALMDNFDTRDAFVHHFNMITAENAHKPDHIAGPGARRTVPTPEEFNFEGPDRITRWAIENDIALVGHAFVWHGQSPDWLFRNEAGGPLPRAEARDRMEFYIRTLSEHFTDEGILGSFYRWDVVNEAFSSSVGAFSGNWRNHMRTGSPWYQAFANTNYGGLAEGEYATDFIWYAFYFARKYFPYSILYYNDYNEHQPGKAASIAQMVEYTNEKWRNHPSYDGRLLIEAIGMQSHFHAESPWLNMDQIRPAIERFIQTGAMVSATELDITLGDHGTPAIPVLSPAQLQIHANAYERVFRYYLELADYISRVSIWGMNDANSWRSSGHPTLFDGRLEAKPAFHAIVDLVQGWEAREVAAPTVIAPTLDPIDLGERVFAQIGLDRVLGVTTEGSTAGGVRRCNAPVWFEVVDGNLPPGVVLHSRTGVLEGTPTAEGIFTFTVEARNYGGKTNQELTIVVGDFDITALSIAEIAGVIDQEAQTITFTVSEDMIIYTPPFGAQFRGTITALEAADDMVIFYVAGQDWPLGLGGIAGVATGDTVRVADGTVYTIIVVVEHPPVYYYGTRPNELSRLLEAGKTVTLQTRGNLGIFEQHSPFVVPAGSTLIIETTLNVQRDAKLIIEGTVIVLDGGRINNQGNNSSIIIAEGGILVNDGHVENVSGSAVTNYGTIINNARFEVRARATLTNEGVIMPNNALNIHRDAIIITLVT